MNNYYSCNFKFLDLRILIKSNLNYPLIWLSEFLRPSFEVSSTAQEYDIEIEHIIDSVIYKQYRNSLPEKYKCIVDVFAMDNKKLRLPQYELSNETILLDESSNVIYVLRNKRTSFLIISPADNIYSRKALMRGVRELATNYCHVKNNLIFHGAALAFKDKGIVIAGPKGAGKTTFLISLLHNKFYSYIANDRLVINPNNNKYSMIGIPTIINIAKATLSSFENFKESVSKENSKYYLTTEEKTKVCDRTRKADPFGNYTLSPLHFCTLLDLEMLNKSNLSLIIFINANKRGKRLSITDLSSSQAAEKLYQNNFRIDSENTNSSFFSMGNKDITINNENIFSQCTDITSVIPSIYCKFNVKSIDYKYIHYELYNRILVQ